MTLQIKNLADCPEIIPLVAWWHINTWREMYLSVGVHNVEENTRLMIDECANYREKKSSLPVYFVGFLGDTPVCTAGIEEDDMPGHNHPKEFRPWLMVVYVLPEYRGGGYGRKIIDFTLHYAAEQQFQEMYLFTPTKESFYIHLGWKTLYHVDYCGDKDCAVMKIEGLTRHEP